MDRHLDNSYDELLKEPWILDTDGTVKPLYGKQEQAVRGCEPAKQGRPSHVCQTYIVASIRMVLEVEVLAVPVQSEADDEGQAALGGVV